VHNDGALGEVCSESYAIGIRDAYSTGYDIVDHPWEAVEAEDDQVGTPGASPQAHLGDALDRDRSEVCPRDEGQQAEDPVQVDAAGRGQPGGKEVQAQVGVGCALRSGVEVPDEGAQRLHVDPAQLVMGDARLEVWNILRGVAQSRGWVPDVQNHTIEQGGKSQAGCGAHRTTVAMWC
jgi:hypothetical protein